VSRGEAPLSGDTPPRGDTAPSDFDWAVRTRIYHGFAEAGRAPVVPEIAAAVGGTAFQVRASLQRLYAAHEIAPLPDGDGVWMANPFSNVPTDFPVEKPTMTCYASCAWDALGVPAILGTDGWVRTQCAESGEALEFGVVDGALSGDDGVIHLVTPIRDAWVDIGCT
jgi:Alkylmercury lyase